MEVVNRDPSFGSSLLNDNFERRPTNENLKVHDPRQVEAIAGSSNATENISEEHSASGGSPDSLLQNPHGATQMFTDMHGIPSALEEGESVDRAPARTGLRHMASLTVGAQISGVTDWETGTDGGKSGKTHVGVPYGSFAGV